mmetsp:Transcript_60710/g.198754  ORF Transcript_60710/g.198754 Transcript_60710/m.198754 type:complete len:373 (+) Transcript_60710:68-1186(+)
MRWWRAGFLARSRRGCSVASRSRFRGRRPPATPPPPCSTDVRTSPARRAPTPSGRYRATATAAACRRRPASRRRGSNLFCRGPSRRRIILPNPRGRRRRRQCRGPGSPWARTTSCATASSEWRCWWRGLRGCRRRTSSARRTHTWSSAWCWAIPWSRRRPRSRRKRGSGRAANPWRRRRLSGRRHRPSEARCHRSGTSDLPSRCPTATTLATCSCTSGSTITTSSQATTASATCRSACSTLWHQARGSPPVGRPCCGRAPPLAIASRSCRTGGWSRCCRSPARSSRFPGRRSSLTCRRLNSSCMWRSRERGRLNLLRPRWEASEASSGPAPRPPRPPTAAASRRPRPRSGARRRPSWSGRLPRDGCRSAFVC